MTGLEKITQQIQADTDNEVNAIVSKAQDKAAAIVQAASDTISDLETDAEQALERELQDLESRAESAAALRRQRILLEGKQQIIADTIRDAHKSLLETSQEEYFQILLKLADKHLQDSVEGKIRFNPADKERLSPAFIESLQSIAKAKQAVLTIDDKTADIDGGFLLIYQDIEENCSFASLFETATETLQDITATLLFNS